MKTYLASLAAMLWFTPALPGSPIPISIESGTIAMHGGFQPLGQTAIPNLVTNTGALTGWTYAWTSYQYGDWQATLPASINPSAMFGSLDASMVIVHNGVSYTFEPRRAAISPDQMNAGAITFPGSIILTSLGSTRISHSGLR